MFRVIGCENVAPVGVEHAPPLPSQLPVTQAKLLMPTVTLLRFRADPAKVTAAPNSLVDVASNPTLGCCR